MRQVFNAIQQKASSVNILVVGDVMLDKYIWGTVSHTSPEAPVAVVDVSGTTYTLGGAANVANNLKKLGCNVDLLGIVGFDLEREIFLSALKESGIDDRFIFFNSSRPTTTKARVMAQNQQILRIDHESAEQLKDSEINIICSKFYNETNHLDAIIFSDYGKGMYHPKPFNLLVEYSGFYNIPLLVDPKGKNWERYFGATAITPNRDELRSETGEWNCADNIDRLFKRIGCQEILITLGNEGMMLCHKESMNDFRVYPICIKDPRTVYDVSGAGDTVMAIFALGLALKQDPVASAELANLTAGIVVQKLGTATATLEEIEDRLNIVSPDTWKPKGKLLSWDDFFNLDRHCAKEKTMLVEGCFETLSPQIVETIQKIKSDGWIVFCDVVSHPEGNCFPLEERLEIALAIDSIDYVFGNDKEFKQRDMTRYFDGSIKLVCPIKKIEEIYAGDKVE